MYSLFSVCDQSIRVLKSLVLNRIIREGGGVGGGGEGGRRGKGVKGHLFYFLTLLSLALFLSHLHPPPGGRRGGGSGTGETWDWMGDH